MKKYIIDCDVFPTVPCGCWIVRHCGGGQVEWDPEKIGSLLFGEDNNCNANILDFLLAHQELIPEEWRNKGYIRFPGTIFGIPINYHGSYERAYADDGHRIRCIKWDENLKVWKG